MKDNINNINNQYRDEREYQNRVPDGKYNVGESFVSKTYIGNKRNNNDFLKDDISLFYKTMIVKEEVFKVTNPC